MVIVGLVSAQLLVAFVLTLHFYNLLPKTVMTQVFWIFYFFLFCRTYYC